MADGGGVIQIKDETCGVCDEEVKSKDKGIECDLCLKWYHAKCTDLPDQLFKALQKFGADSLKWYCKGCKGMVDKVLGRIAKLEDRQQSLESEVDGMKKEVMELR